MPRLLSISSIVNAPHGKYNRYVSGSGVSANTTSNHRVKNRKASRKIPRVILQNNEYDERSVWPHLGGSSNLNHRSSRVATRDTIRIEWEGSPTSPYIVCDSASILTHNNSIIYNTYNQIDQITNLPTKGYLVATVAWSGENYNVWSGFPASEGGFAGTTPAVGSHGDILYLVGANGTLFAVDIMKPDQPRFLFQANHFSGAEHHASASPILDSHNQVLYGSLEGEFVSADAISGDLRWRVNFNSILSPGHNHVVQNMCAVSGAAAGTIFVVSRTPGFERQGYLWALNPTTGARVWGTTGSGTLGYFETNGFIPSAPVLSANSSVVYIVVQDQNSNYTYLVAINAATGALIWNTQIMNSNVFEMNSLSISPIDGSIFLSTNVTVTEGGANYPFAYLSCFNPNDGGLRWSCQLSGNEIGGAVTTGTDTTPCCDASGNVVVTYYATSVGDPSSPSGYSYVAKISGLNGAVLWTERLNYASYSFLSPTIGADGSVIVASTSDVYKTSQIKSFI